MVTAADGDAACRALVALVAGQDVEVASAVATDDADEADRPSSGIGASNGLDVAVAWDVACKWRSWALGDCWGRRDSGVDDVGVGCWDRWRDDRHLDREIGILEIS